MEIEYDTKHLILIVAGIAYASGLITHLFIIITNVLEWLKGRSMNAVDIIVTSLGMSRTCFLFFPLLDLALYASLPDHPNIYSKTVFFFIIHLSNTWDVILTALFSVVFCLKISNFHNTHFLRLKAIISQKIVHLIASSLLVSICFISLFTWIDMKMNLNILGQNTTINATHSPPKLHFYIYGTIQMSLPFLTYCTSTVLLITSLCLHIKRMRCNSSVTVHLDTYYKAIKFMTWCFVCFIFRVGVNLMLSHFFYSLNILWAFVIWNTPPTLHSIYLICATNKLKSSFFWILKQGSNCWFNTGGSEIRSRD